MAGNGANKSKGAFDLSNDRAISDICCRTSSNGWTCLYINKQDVVVDVYKTTIFITVGFV